MNTGRTHFKPGHIPHNKGEGQFKNCLGCGKDLWVINSRLKRGEGKYCSRKCMGIAFRGRTSWNKGLGKNSRVCPICGNTKSLLAKVCKKCDHHVPWNKDTKYTPEMKSRLNMKGLKKGRHKGKNMSKLKGRNNPMSNPITVAKVMSNPKVQANWFKKGHISLNKGVIPSGEQLRKMLIIRSPNKDEHKLNYILKTNFPKEWKFVGNGKVSIEGKNPDFMNINGKKLIIDLFGKHWHDESEVEPRKKLFATYGYKTLILWDYELKDEKYIIEQVKTLYER